MLGWQLVAEPGGLLCFWLAQGAGRKSAAILTRKQPGSSEKHGISLMYVVIIVNLRCIAFEGTT